VGSPKLGHTPSLAEDEIVQRIRSALGGGFEALGLRDDAAVLAVPGTPSALVASVDSVVEGVHFDLSLSSVADVGWKALMSALSDLAAMGASPLGALVALCAPGLAAGAETAVGVMGGVAEAAAAAGCPVAGGDVSEADLLVVSVTVLGTVESGAPVARSGASAGDVLFVTGACGGSAAGLRQLRSGAGVGVVENVQRHRRPVARLTEGRLAQAQGAHAMIDVSDGLALDLHRLADASGIGFALDTVPVAEGASLEEALGGGEDYELLMAVGAGGAEPLVSAFVDAGLAAPLRIGVAGAIAATRTLEGRPLGRLGWQHGGDHPAG
jgi:thiamine-monophosphate kinase